MSRAILHRAPAWSRWQNVARRAAVRKRKPRQNESQQGGLAMRLEGKTALITGASRSIARGVALTFVREGADLVLNTRSSRAELDEVAGKCRELGVKTPRRWPTSPMQPASISIRWWRTASRRWARLISWSAPEILTDGPPAHRAGHRQCVPVLRLRRVRLHHRRPVERHGRAVNRLGGSAAFSGGQMISSWLCCF